MIQEILVEAADTLAAVPYFSDVAIVSEDKGDPSNTIDMALAKLGIGVQVVAPKGDVTQPDIPGPYFSNIDFIVAVYENVVTNRGTKGTGKPALSVVEQVLATLHWHKPTNYDEIIKAASPAWILIPDEHFLCYHCLFKTEGGISSPLPDLVDPTVTFADNGNSTYTATITGGTQYANIFYTTDGTMPAPRAANGEGTALLYTAPFIVTPGQIVKVRGWLAGYKAGKPQTFNI